MERLKILPTITLLFFLLKSLMTAELFESPCPELFEYTGQNKKANEWFGTVVLLSDIDLLDIWIHLQFDNPILELKNAFGELVTTNGKDCFIEKPNFELKANKSHRFSFILKYAPNEPVPQLVSYKLNGKLICSEHLLNTAVNDICGTLTEYSESKKVNDELTYPGAFPWHAMIHFTKPNGNRYICVASLISPHYLITLARCFFNKTSFTYLEPEKIQVTLGRHFGQNNLRERVQIIKAQKIIPHPDYNSTADYHNIALLKLSRRANITAYVRPICLWQETTPFSSLLNKEGTVVGWGSDVTGHVSPDLIQSKMLIVPNEKCINSLPVFSRDSYCARYKEGTAVCSGNEGGGMMFWKSHPSAPRQVWEIRGLVSMGGLSALNQKCDTSHYISFIDTALYLDWIKRSIE